MDALAQQLQSISDWITLHITMWVLVGTGIVLTIATRGVQLRHLPAMVRQVAGSRSGAGGGISSFQAFTISLAARVGIGNVFGVAAALILGGPGAIFWMWMVALVGMATAFFEATLAQLFKTRHADGSFRGGPAYYMARGMRSRPLGVAFAALTIFTCGFSIIMVQANAVAGVIGPASPLGLSQGAAAAVLVGLSALVILGGVRRVARVTEWMSPIMALIYMLLALIIVCLHLTELGAVLWTIITSAFGPQPFAGGVTGGILAALINGTKRGLFSNEAGQGTAPFAAATATVAHPVQQGLIQSLGVFVDTIVVCTATAFIILVSGVYSPAATAAGTLTPEAAATLTSDAVAAVLGGWTAAPMAVLIFVLAYSSIIAAATYSEVSMTFISPDPRWRWLPRLVSVASTGLGALATLTVVWNTVDITMALMTVTNLVALLALARWGVGALRDWEAQRRAGIADPVLVSTDNPYLPADLPGDVWAAAGPPAQEPTTMEARP
ncbi:alanine:cation symporter family protein [Actinomyces bowdenii]|uniref:Alanine:cation symporter family protein n=1 Tax=Actinomyces bowdenii TaxID=131109 RepID=A0A3P1V6E1_9ACTO|nr:alanine/glycine:cation symporter family protein [Actinomyces bowdenii]MBO3724541.1 alanine:cation symporter family protein [Actinomyces bowdenii]RRD29709.1 alanine:cation symporter family protein [Actinomyces bowdenii]